MSLSLTVSSGARLRQGARGALLLALLGLWGCSSAPTSGEQGAGKEPAPAISSPATPIATTQNSLGDVSAAPAQGGVATSQVAMPQVAGQAATQGALAQQAQDQAQDQDQDQGTATQNPAQGAATQAGEPLAKQAPAPVAKGDEAELAEFDPSFLQGAAAKNIDMQRFERGNYVLPGRYRSDIYLNDKPITVAEVQYLALGAEQTTQPCLSQALIEQLPLDQTRLPLSLWQSAAPRASCLLLGAKGKETILLTFDSSQQRLDIVVPQAMVSRKRQEIDPSLWDRGVTSATLNYNFFAFHSQNDGSGQSTSSDSASMTLGAGFNYQDWYLRHSAYVQRDSDGQTRYQSGNTYVQHDIAPLRSRLEAGQVSTQGQLFGSVPLTGFKLYSVDAMYPSDQFAYAPEIRGVARTNARVMVRQNGRVLYETVVPAGEFLIDDVHPFGYGDDLLVTVTEADGRVDYFKVPFTSVANLMRPNSARYTFAMGEYRDSYWSAKPLFSEFTYERGLSNALTGNAGTQLSSDYLAMRLGAAYGTSIGAFALGVTHARTNLQTPISGQSYSLTYNTTLPATHSNLTIGNYRYNSQNYLDFAGAVNAVEQEKRSWWRYQSSTKNQASISVNQGLPAGFGSFYVTGSLNNYWDQEGTQRAYNAGWGNHYRLLSYNLNMDRSEHGYYGANREWENRYTLSLSMPLTWSTRNQPNLNLRLDRDDKGQVTQNWGVGGSAGERSQYSYGANWSHSANGSDSQSLYGGYMAPYSQISAGHSRGSGYQSSNLGLSGGVVAHPGGVTFTSSMGDTLAVVEAPDAAGASLVNQGNARLDGSGHAVVPYLSPYNFNEIALDPVGMSQGVELESTMQKVVPQQGAVVMVKFKTHKGYPLLIDAKQANGQALPFGAEVLDEAGNSVGNVGQGSQVFAKVAAEQGQLRVQWGAGAAESCQLSYTLTDTQQLTQLTQPCIAEPQVQIEPKA